MEEGGVGRRRGVQYIPSTATCTKPWCTVCTMYLGHIGMGLVREVEDKIR